MTRKRLLSSCYLLILSIVKLSLLLFTYKIDLYAEEQKKSDSSTTIVTEDTLKEEKSLKKRDIVDTINYEANNINYDAENKILTLIGKAKIEYQSIILIADTIVYLMNENLFTAKGTPMLIEGTDTTVGDYMVYNIKTRRGRVNYASAYLREGFFNGAKIIKSEENVLYVEEGVYTSCAKIDTPHYCFYGKNIKFIPNDKIISRPMVLNIGGVPVAALPYFIFPLEKKRRSGFLTPRWGGHPSGGGYLDNIGYYFVPNEYVDFTLSSRVYEFSEFVTSLRSSYNKRYLLNGSFNARYVLNTGFLRSSNEWAIDYSHNQNLTPDGKTTIAGKGSLVSRKNFYSLFSEDSSELREQKLTADLFLSRELESIRGKFNLSWQRSHNLKTNIIQEDIPQVTFSLPSRPLIPSEKEDGTKVDTLKWFHNIYWGYDSRGIVRHVKSPDKNIKESFRTGMTQSLNLSSPQKIFKWITFTPSFSGRVSTFVGYMDTAILRYDTISDTVQYIVKDISSDKQYPDYKLLRYDTLSRNQYAEPETIRVVKYKDTIIPVRAEYPDKVVHDAFWNTGFGLSTTLYGIFPFGLFNIVGFRHTMSPSISYSFVPEKKLDKKFYDIGIEYRNASKRSQAVSLSVSNLFEGKYLKKNTKDGKFEEKKFSLFSFNLSTGYDFEAKSEKWRDLNISGSTGFDRFRLSPSASFWMYDENKQLSLPIIKSFSLGVSIGTLNAKGTLWGGDLLVLDSLAPDDSIKYGNKNNNSWSISLSPSYSFFLSRSSQKDILKPTRNYGLSGQATLYFTRNWQLFWSGNYNFQTNQWVQSSINMRCDLECWDMEFQWRPEKLNPGYYFLIRIKKIPEIKWEQRG
ncbi:MAG: putative LPS assembly protein LptD [Chitinispirillaceae bacterium]|nr:putative LPS assembly protein LptD [Chitinispirillaceae bacterium]